MSARRDFAPVPRFCALVAALAAPKNWPAHAATVRGRPLTLAVATVRRSHPDLALAVLEEIGSWPSSEPELAELQRQLGRGDTQPSSAT